MKSSPAKGLSNFFSTLGRKGTEERQKKQTQENQGMTNFEKRRAEKKSRKAGESKYQADIRRKQEKRKAEKADVASDAEFFGKHRKAGTTPGTPITPKKATVANEPKLKAKSTKPNWTKAPKVGTQARIDWYKKHNLALDDTTKLKEEQLQSPNADLKKFKKSKLVSDQRKFYVDKDQDNIRDAIQGTTSYDPNMHISPERYWEKYNKTAKQRELNELSQLADGSAFNKKSPYKKGIGSYAKKAKGSRGFKMNRK